MTADAVCCSQCSWLRAGERRGCLCHGGVFSMFWRARFWGRSSELRSGCLQMKHDLICTSYYFMLCMLLLFKKYYNIVIPV